MPHSTYKLSIVTLLMACFWEANAQVGDSIRITKGLVKSGVVMPLPTSVRPGGCPRYDGITIQSKEDTVYAIDTWTVAFVSTIADYQLIIFRQKKGVVVYDNLLEVFVAQGDSVRPGQAVGLIQKEDNRFEMEFKVTDNKGVYWRRNNLLEILQKKVTGSQP